MQGNIAVSSRAVRVLAAAVFVLAAVVVVGWWASQARADHNPEATLHACAAPNGVLRLADDCQRLETAHALATEAGQAANQDRIAALETHVTDLDAANAEVEAANAALAERVAELEAAETSQESGETSDESTASPETTSDATCDPDQGDVCDEDSIHVEELLAGITRTTVDGRDTLIFEGMNLQVVNGTDTTHGTPNGLGNVIVGYNAPRSGGATNPATDRVGSHYLVAGDEHHWTSYGGLLAGLSNTASGPAASVFGGWTNTASGDLASVTGGIFNTASGHTASVTGGDSNTASGDLASVTGGNGNTASADLASVSGGEGNTATSPYASVSGGYDNTADGFRASILGGNSNTVSTQDACHPTC